MNKNKTPKEHADDIFNAFDVCWGKEKFSELVEFMDGDRDNDLLQAMKEIDQKNFPGKYVKVKDKKRGGQRLAKKKRKKNPKPSKHL